MNSYFVQRRRFVVNAWNFKHMVQQQQTYSEQRSKWQMLRQFSRAAESRTIPQDLMKVGPTINNRLIRGQKQNDIQSQEHKKQQSKQHALRRWTGFLLWIPFGAFVIGAIEWQLHKKQCQHEHMLHTASKLQTLIYCSLPLRILSRCFGWLAACNLPISLRPYIYGWYSNKYKVNLHEAMYSDFEHYNSLAEFFTRPLKEGARIIDANSPLVSPADGKILHFGKTNKAHIEQVKGVNYRIQDFLGPVVNQNENATDSDSYVAHIQHHKDGSTQLFQCVIYLAPGDYHRFHSPTAWQPNKRRHFSGELLSVNPKLANWLPGLFCLNERVLYMGKWKYGFFSYTAVGATNVGSVHIYMDDKLKTNRWMGFNIGAHNKYRDCDEIVLAETILNKGDLFGQFNMGSTIVLIFEAPKNFKFDIVAGERIRVGESLGHIAER